jgi:hypothetical protein
MTRPLGHPEDWSDANKLRLLAEVFDSIDKALAEGKEVDMRIFDPTNDSIQRDLRRIADDLEQHETTMQDADAIQDAE